MTISWRFWCFSPFGAPMAPFRACPFGEHPFGVHPFGVRPFGVRPFGARPFGARPFGAPPSGVRPFGARWAGPPLPCVGWKYWKSSQEKVPWKTVLYFLEKTFKMFWNLSSSSDLVKRIREQFFLSKIDRRSLELWHFFSNMRDIKKTIGSFHFFASISPFPMKNPVLPNFLKMI